MTKSAKKIPTSPRIGHSIPCHIECSFMSLIQNEDCSLPYPKAALMAVAIDSKCDRFAQSVSPRLSKLMRLCVYDFKNSTTPRLR